MKRTSALQLAGSSAKRLRSITFFRRAERFVVNAGIYPTSSRPNSQRNQRPSQNLSHPHKPAR